MRAPMDEPDPDHHLLVVYHSQSGGTQALADACVQGASNDQVTGVDVRVRRALDADAEDLRWADAIVLGTPENFGYMSGALKDFFDRVFYTVLDETRGRPWALFVKGAHDDGSGAVSAVTRIVTGLGWRQARPPLVVIGEVTDHDRDQAWELGATMAAGLAQGIW
jgi:multimeric flavodoxin WrbA